MNRMAVILAALVFFLGLSDPAVAAENKTTTTAQKVPLPVTRPTAPPVRPMLGMVTGAIVKINSADPNNVTLEVKSDTDGSIAVVTIMPWTNITKVTDVTELKAGDAVRIMSRKADNKDVAMGVIFGNIKPRPPIQVRTFPVAQKAAPVLSPQNHTNKK